MLERMDGYTTGISQQALLAAGVRTEELLGRKLDSFVVAAAGGAAL